MDPNPRLEKEALLALRDATETLLESDELTAPGSSRTAAGRSGATKSTIAPPARLVGAIPDDDALRSSSTGTTGTRPSGKGLGIVLGRLWQDLYYRIFMPLPKAESFELIRLNMLAKWLLKAEECTVIAFTSRSRGEGVSTVVAGLARSLAATDPTGVLVIDACGRRRGVVPFLRAKGPQAKLQGWETNLRDWVVRAENANVDVFALSDAGPPRQGSAKQVDAILRVFRRDYRTILVDAGSLVAGWAACWLASANYRVLVLDSSITTREILDHHRNELQHSGIVLDGFILNKRTYPIPRSLYWLAR